MAWENDPPPDIPFARSTDIVGYEYLNGTNYNYGGFPYNKGAADTWYPTWSSNGNLYTPWTDGRINCSQNGTYVLVQSHSYTKGNMNETTTGYATVIGDDPSNLFVTDCNLFTSSSYPFYGRYPCGSLVYNNTWFYGTYLINQTASNGISCGNECGLGPFVGYRWSKDYGKSWTEPRMYVGDNYGDKTIFKENNNNLQKIKFGEPHVVDFGQELKYSPDGRFYIVGHGANLTTSPQSWMQGDQVYMARNYPIIEAVNDSNEWEFYTNATGENGWIKGNVYKSTPLFTWLNRTGVVTMTYFNVLKKYIMSVSTPTYSPITVEPFDTYFLESDNITGPFRYIIYMKQFGPQGYFLNYPSKFLADEVNGSYYEMFLSYSANYINQHQETPWGSGYHWALQKSRFKLSQSFLDKLSNDNDK